MAVRQAHVVAEADTYLHPVLAIIDLFRVSGAWNSNCHPLVNPERAVRAVRLGAV